MRKKFLLFPLVAALAVLLATPATADEDYNDEIDLDRVVVPFLVKMDVGAPEPRGADDG